MATVTGYTKAKMEAITNEYIVSGAIVGDDLVLTKYGGGTVNAGNVRGPVGAAGAETGTFIFGGWDVDPTGYLIMDGATIVGGATTYSALAALFPTWVSGNDLVLPNADGVVPLVDNSNPGIVTGSMTHTISSLNQLPQHNHTPPNHRHTIAHGHGDSFSLSDPGHAHPAGGYSLNDNSGPGKFYTRVGTSGINYDWYGGGTLTQWASYTYPPTSSTDSNVSLSGGVTSITTSSYSGYDSSGTTSTVGSASPSSIDHTPRHIKVRMAVKT